MVFTVANEYHLLNQIEQKYIIFNKFWKNEHKSRSFVPGFCNEQCFVNMPSLIG